MLTEWELRKSRLKKKLALWTYQGAHLRRAACLHALCERELSFFRTFGFRNPVCLIPNGVQLSQASGARPGSAAPWEGRMEGGRKVLLYLARINRKKGVHFLLDAWSEALRDVPQTVEWALVIAGWDQDGHEAQFRNQVRSLGLERHVCFVGPLFGADKAAAFEHAAAFVLPSQDEGQPIGVLEAWWYALPVLMTRQCNLPEGFQAGAAIAAEPSSESLRAALETLFTMPDSQRSEMGANGRKLVEDRFTWPNVARQMKEVYEWLVGGGRPPACVIPATR